MLWLSKMQTLTRRGVGDAAAGLGLHFLHMFEGPFSYDAGHLFIIMSISPNARNMTNWIFFYVESKAVCRNYKTRFQYIYFILVLFTQVYT